MSGINNIFYTLLLLFTSYLFVLDGGISILSSGVVPLMSLVLSGPRSYVLSNTNNTSGLTMIL